MRGVRVSNAPRKELPGLVVLCLKGCGVTPSSRFGVRRSQRVGDRELELGGTELADIVQCLATREMPLRFARSASGHDEDQGDQCLLHAKMLP